MAQSLLRAVRGIALLLCLAHLSDARPRAIPNVGPCSRKVTASTTLFAKSTNDLNARKAFPNTTTVLMYLSGNITLTNTLDIGSAFSCTIFKADPALGGEMPFFYYPDNDKVAVRMHDVTNLIFIGIGFQQDWTYQAQPKCNWTAQGMNEPWIDSSWTCPGVLIYRCFNVQISQGYLGGRTDVYRAGSVEISYSTLVSDNDYWGAQANAAWGNSWCTVRFAYCGDNANLIRSNNKLAHNIIKGSWTSVFVYWASVGVIVQNNYISDFWFAGLQCGQGMRNVADCMLNTFELNYIVNSKGNQTDTDGAGIYYDLHWFNPGNRDSCNFVQETPHCYYIDYCTSGLLVEGAVCFNTNDGIKVNTGKFNTFKSIVIVEKRNTSKSTFNTGFISAQNWCMNRCGPGTDQAQGMSWWNGYLNSFNNPLWQTNYPLLRTVCTATSYTFEGVSYSCNPAISTVPSPCNPAPCSASATPYCYRNMTVSNNATGTYNSANATLSGNCSGIPVLNNYESLIFVTNVVPASSFWGTIYPPDYLQEAAFGAAIPSLNFINKSLPKYAPNTLGFNNEASLDYGADNPSAPIYQKYTNFYSCPRRLVGPQTAVYAKARHANSIYSKFSRHAPRWMRKHRASHPTDLAAYRMTILEYGATFKRNMNPRSFRRHMY